MLEIHPDLGIKYGTSFIPADFPDSGKKIVRTPAATSRFLGVAKIHGSTNWLYCDNCRRVYWFPPSQSMKIADQILSADEWKRIAPRPPANAKNQWECSQCDAVTLGTRIATFSYRKALDFPMFQQSWNAAEKFLASAQRWVFIGYSLPAADYEFKYLLKRIELSRKKPPDIILVTGGDGATTARRNYRRFFGNRLTKQEFQHGLDDNAIACIIT